MEKLVKFIAYRYFLAKEYGNAQKMCDQAFGALELYHTMNPDQFDECEALWLDTWYPKFAELIYGGATND